MNFSITQINASEIKAFHRAEYIVNLFLAFFLAIVALIFFLLRRIDWAFVGVLFLSFAGYLIWKPRELVTIINRSNGTLWQRKGGFLGTHLNAREIIHNLAEIRRLEIKRFVRRGDDSFKIRVAVESTANINEEIYLTHDLTFSEAHQYAEQIHHFLGKEIPLKAVD